jgi:site-specific DNA-methyltransferase (adenine-specific)
MTPLLTAGHNYIYQTDVLVFLRTLVDETVDVVVTSPPYNLRNSTGNGLKARNDKNFWSTQPMRYGYSTHADDMPHEEYIAWQRQCLREMLRALKPTGAIFYNHKWRVQDGLLQRLADDITDGFPVRQIIIWNRRNGFNFNETYFLPTYEVIYLIAKSDFRLREGANTLKDLWDITPSEGKEHPNSFPIELPRRCLQACYGALVVDPFSGIGTTARAALELGWNYLGCDISPEYVEIARRELFKPFTVPMFAA